VDLAFCVPDWSRFEQLKAELVGSGRFTPGGITPRLRHRIGTPLDLIPFGGVASATGQVAWPPDGNPVMSVLATTQPSAAQTPYCCRVTSASR
jgi:predicted nucleotidyltransferase